MDTQKPHTGTPSNKHQHLGVGGRLGSAAALMDMLVDGVLGLHHSLEAAVPLGKMNHSQWLVMMGEVMPHLEVYHPSTWITWPPESISEHIHPKVIPTPVSVPKNQMCREHPRPSCPGVSNSVLTDISINLK